MDRERGSVAVEATIVVPIFLIAVFFVMNFMNIFMLHNRIQYAINASAHELASYSYLYTATGVGDAVSQIEEDGSAYTSKLDDASSSILDCMEKIQNLSNTQDLSGVTDSGKTAYQSVKELITDPKSTLIGAGYTLAEAGIYGAKSWVATASIKSLTKKYLAQEDQTADEYLKSYGVADGYSGLNFNGSSMLNDSDEKIIDVVVEYDVDLTGFGLVVPGAKLTVVQRVSVPAWLDGDGKSPKSYNITK